MFYFELHYNSTFLVSAAGVLLLCQIWFLQYNWLQNISKLTYCRLHVICIECDGWSTTRKPHAGTWTQLSSRLQCGQTTIHKAVAA